MKNRRFVLLGTTLFSLAVVVIALTAALPAFAAKPCWDEDHNKIECPPDPSDPPADFAPITVALDGEEIWENTERGCALDPGSTESSGYFDYRY